MVRREAGELHSRQTDAAGTLASIRLPDLDLLASLRVPCGLKRWIDLRKQFA